MTSRSTGAVVATLGVALAGTLLCGAAAPDYLAAFVWHLRAGLYAFVPATLLIMALLGMSAHALMAATERTMVLRLLGYGLPLFALTIAALAWSVSFHAYQSDRIYYTAGVKAERGELPALATRVPYQMATAQARSNLGEISGRIPEGGTTYLPRRNEFGTLVERKGWLTGYEAVLTQAMDEAGTPQPYVCKFVRDKARARHDGWFSHNLARAINSEDMRVRYDPADMWGYCDEDVPMLVVPLKRQVGWLYVTERPAGYVVYNGHTGKITRHRDGHAGQRVPGPTYPLSLAARQREALQAPGGYWDWRAGRGGWEPTDEDVNSGNATEFTLGTDIDHDPVFVTPLTGRGSATAISATAMIDATLSDPGSGLATVWLYRNQPTWKSVQAIESRIKDDYSDLQNWQNVRVYEIAPTGGDTWVATVGIRDGHTISYRVRGSGDLYGANATCLHHPVDDTRLRCGRIYAKPGGLPPGGPAPAELLAGVPDQQLVEELARRLARS